MMGCKKDESFEYYLYLHENRATLALTHCWKALQDEQRLHGPRCLGALTYGHKVPPALRAIYDGVPTPVFYISHILNILQSVMNPGLPLSG